MTDDNFKEKFSIRISVLNAFVFFISGLFVFVFILGLFISFSPLKEYVPGKTSVDIQKELFLLNLRSDSLVLIIKQRDVYLQNLRAIISGEEFIVSNLVDSVFSSSSSLDFEPSKEDSLLRVSVESEETGSLFEVENPVIKAFVFFKPVDGMISDSFNKKTTHFGTDIVAKKNASIKSVLEGTVVINHWTPNTGYVVGIQHSNGFFSLYKHNSLILKSVGDFVLPGEQIAIIGNSGEFSSGPHLHFELWYNGSPVDPEDYIVF